MIRKQAFGGQKVANPFGEQNDDSQQKKPLPPRTSKMLASAPFGNQNNEEEIGSTQIKKNTSRPTGKLPTDAFSAKQNDAPPPAKPAPAIGTRQIITKSPFGQ